MKRPGRFLTLAAATLVATLASSLSAQTVEVASAKAAPADTTVTAPAAPRADSVTPPKTAAKTAAALLLNRTIELQHVRPADQRGLNVFEAPKDDVIPFTGVKLVWGGAFTQQFQGIRHSNSADPKLVAGVNQNQLLTIGNGFNNATANLNLGVQLAPGIRIALSTYASSRHHQETWVKDGYFLMDASPIDQPLLNAIMKYTTLRVGHFEINYGDQHFRRSDNGNTIYNPFVGNLLIDAFTTEIGGEVYFRNNGFLAMAGITGGEIKGQITVPEKRAPSYLGKIGFDKQLSPMLRTRLTGSMYTTKRSASNTLLTGDRAGSRYYSVIENTTATDAAQAWSGSIRPGMSDNVTGLVINPFVKLGGLELFGNLEQFRGKAATETTNRTWNQYAGEVLYRFLPREQMYIATRHNAVSGDLVGVANSVSVNRTQLAAGWFVTPSLLAKIEWVTQKYNDFPTADIRSGGRFSGFVMEGAVAF